MAGAAVDFTMDAAGDLSTAAQAAVHSAANQVQNTVTRMRDTNEPEDMVTIHEARESEHRHPIQQLMEDQHIVKEPTRWGVAMHDVSFSGLGGAMFLIMLASVVLFVASFSSIGWAVEQVSFEEGEMSSYKKGLWEECVCQSIQEQESYFTATQVMVTMGFVTLCLAMVCITLYMCLCLNVIRKTYLLFVLMATSCLTVLLLFVALIVFGAGETRRLGWSYGMSIIATFLCGLSGAFAFLQLRRSLSV